MKVVKKNNPDMLIAICGCMMQEPDEIEKSKQIQIYRYCIWYTQYF